MTQDQCKADAISMANMTISQIEAIDKETPFSHREPKWWMDMMDIQRKLYTFVENHDRD